ncbi:MAG: tyrosinase family protein [Rhodospirillales bacterium]|nr:tyrosinase family protein [Rhodospirillales bacterium]
MVTRRTLLKSSLAIGAATVFSGTIPNISLAQQTVRVRRSLHGMALDDPDLVTFRDFVGIMKKNDQGQAVSWLGFSLQHGKVGGDYKYCPHGDWYFLPWHREYVNMYENAAIEFTGNKSFAMPYWDWTIDRTLPEAFADPKYKGLPNPLYVPNRKKINLPDNLVGPKIMAEIYSETLYEVFGTSRNRNQNDLNPQWIIRGGGIQGTLEATPHNNVHNLIGAYMPTAGSPRDPIFMMHHCNIDRIWAYWNALGRKNSDAALWLNMPFKDNFIAANGSLYSKVVKDLQDTNKLGYTYSGMPGPDNLRVDSDRHRKLLSLFGLGAVDHEKMQHIQVKNTKAARASKFLNTPFSLKPSTLKSVSGPALLESSAGRRLPEVFAVIKDIHVGKGVSGFRVFINSKDVTLNTSSSDPHFVATIAFLSTAKSSHKMAPSAIVDLTDTIRELSELKEIKDDKISVQLIPVPKPGMILKSTGSVVPGSIEIAVI